MCQITTTPFQQFSIDKLRFVMFIKHTFHSSPETFLPFEDSFFRYHIRSKLGIQTSLKEQMCEWFNIVVGIVVHHHNIVIVFQITFVHNKGWITILGQISCKQCPLSHLGPTSTVFTTDGMSFEKYGTFVSQFDAFNVNGIPTNGNPIPSPTHGTIGTRQRFGQIEFFHLQCRGCYGWFFENCTNLFPSGDSIFQYLIIGLIARYTTQIICLPLLCIKKRMYPFIEDELTSVSGHFFTLVSTKHKREKKVREGGSE